MVQLSPSQRNISAEVIRSWYVMKSEHCSGTLRCCACSKTDLNARTLDPARSEHLDRVLAFNQCHHRIQETTGFPAIELLEYGG